MFLQRYLIYLFLCYFYDKASILCDTQPPNNIKTPKCVCSWFRVERRECVEQSTISLRGVEGGSPPFNFAYGKCICPFPKCPHLSEWEARQPAGTALVYVHNIVCFLHICAVSRVGVMRIYDGPAASDRWCAFCRTSC